MANSDDLFEEARRVRKVGQTSPWYRTDESYARQLEQKAWVLKRQELTELMKK